MGHSSVYRTESQQSLEPLISPYRKKRLQLTDSCRSCLSFTIIILLFCFIGALVYFIYPKHVYVTIDMVRINRNTPISSYENSLDVNWNLRISILNPNFYSLNKKSFCIVGEDECSVVFESQAEQDNSTLASGLTSYYIPVATLISPDNFDARLPFIKKCIVDKESLLNVTVTIETNLFGFFSAKTCIKREKERLCSIPNFHSNLKSVGMKLPEDFFL